MIVADRAGVTKRTLYVKVGDKEALFSAVVSDMLQAWRTVVHGSGPADTLQKRFEHLGLQLLSVMLRPDMVRLNRVLLSEAYRFPSLVSLLVAQIEQGPIPQLARLLVEARGPLTASLPLSPYSPSASRWSTVQRLPARA